MALSIVSNEIEEMQAINYWSDVTQFAGCIVAYKTNSPHLEGTSGLIVSDEDTYFGIINSPIFEWSPGLQRGHSMIRLVRYEENLPNCGLNAKTLGSHTTMRLASPEEKKIILHAIMNCEAKFGSSSELDLKAYFRR